LHITKQAREIHCNEDLKAMPRIQHSILIRKPIGQIYDYLTTPKYWPDFHPASLEETGATEHPLRPGDRHREKFRTRGWTGHINWTTLEADRPSHFRMRGEVEGVRGNLFITFRAVERAGGVELYRELEYARSNWLLRLIDKLYLHGHMTRESLTAWEQLKRNLESC
jgi:uncharacterized protein YndB with AHSA1/START domain